MTNPRDEIDDWLAGEVNPLSPPPGALDRIRRRARQRKLRQVAVASAGCAVLLAAAVTIPQIALAPRSGPGHPPVAAGRTPVTTAAAPRQSRTAGPATPEASTSTQLEQRTRLSVTTTGTVPPPHFRPTSVTFVGTGSGDVVGAVIGQAGPPCATAECTSLAGTSDYGGHWYGVSAPVAPAPHGDAGVSQLRFANLRDGWAFGPALYETSGGGWPWQQEDTYGQRVIDLEASGQAALAIFATCSGSGGYASGCTSFALYRSTAGSTTWTPVTVPVGYQHVSVGQPSSASLVIRAGTGYLLAPSGAVLSGPLSGGAWTVAGHAPCKPGTAQASGAPAGAQLAVNQTQLMLTCAGQPGAATSLYTSATGAVWNQAGTAPTAGAPTSLASAAPGQVVLATTAGISVSDDDGTSWRSARIEGPAPAGGFAYVGMTNSLQGVAVPADSALGEVFVTRDGGASWRPSPIAG